MLKWATLAACLWATMALANCHHQRVELIEQRCAKFRWIVSKRNGYELLYLRIFPLPPGQSVAFGDAAQIFIDHRNRVTERIEQNCISGFLTDSGQSQHLASEWLRRLRGERGQRTTVLPIEKSDKRFDRRRLAHHVTRRTDETAQFLFGDFAETFKAHHSARNEVGDRPLHSLPRGVLGQVCAYDHLQRSLRGPPVLRPVGSAELVMKVAQNSGCSRVVHSFDFCRCFFQPSSLAFNASASASAIMPLC